MSSTNKTTNYNLSQFVGTDIPSILNDYNGDMQKIDTAVHNVAVAEGDNASNIVALQSTVSGQTSQITQIDSNVTAVSGRVLTVEGKVTTIEGVIPANASTSNKLVTENDIPDISQLEQDVADLQTNVTTIDGEVNNIKSVIPASASASNLLATMADVQEEIYSPTSLLYGESIRNITLLKSDYTTMGDLFKAVYDKVLEIYNTASINESVILTVTAENHQFVMHPVKSGVTGTQGSFSFEGTFIATGSATPIIHAYMEVYNSNTSGYFIERALAFTNSYYGDNIPSPITNGDVTGYEIKHTADETTTSPASVIVHKMVNKAIV